MAKIQTPPKQKKIFIGAIDNGFGKYKLYVEDHPLQIIPSYVSEEKMDAVPGRVSIDGKAFTVGESAYRSGKYYSRNVDDAGNKIQQAKVMLLGALAHLPHRKEWHLKVVVSIHDSDNFKEALIQALSGKHNCLLRGEESTVCVEVLKVIPEGMGALFGKNIPDKLSVLDFGTGTTLFSRYSEGKRIKHEPESGGVEQLIELISIEMKAMLNGIHGDKQLIRQGLESGTLTYGRSTSFDQIYEKCLVKWRDKCIREPVKKAKEAYESGDEVLCIGGGCLLPGFKESLEAIGFKVHKKPVTANVEGLFKIAEKLSGKVK